MRYALIATFLAFAALVHPAAAEERVTLGVGRLFTNDTLGDGQDRWHTGSYVASWMRGAPGTVDLPERIGAVMEYRFSSRIIAPDDLVTPAPGDRRYAGVLSVGAYTHFARGGFEITAGGELVAVGPQTGLDRFHTRAHGVFGLTVPSAATKAGQIGNAIYPTAAFEAARPFEIGAIRGAVLRPFIQGRAGDETYLRVGADLLIGANFTTGLLARDETTGILYQTIRGGGVPGFSVLLGADTAGVLRSAWLPATGAATPTTMRNRVRAGVNWQGERVGVFYGASWLGPEFNGQASGQVVGSLQLRARF